jgi:mono/diheme cytochrome c family protein/glucose/arabinose dehydrogenase
MGLRQEEVHHPSKVKAQAEAPVLSVREALDAFSLVEGFKIEAVASEPMVVDPVAMAFDEDGRIWVVEMQTYMPDMDATGELTPNNRVVVLEDKDGDGEMEATTFIDGLVLPRAIAPSHGGLLLIEPPNLYFCKDLDGDGRADEKRLLMSGFGGRENPEHAANGLLYGIDNWIYLSQHGVRIRFDGERVETQRTPAHGQWGITQDDAGRLYYTPNSDTLRGDVFPKHYASRNRNQRNTSGMNLRVGQDLTVFASRLNIGVNRAYRDGTLREDGRLSTVTAACGPTIYRAGAFGSEFCGDAFVCEASGNLVKRLAMSERDGIAVGRNAYEDYEFLTSTDERFRPVNAYTGPDGALYIVDMYRGVIQHKTYLTDYLKGHIRERKLEKLENCGRIYRISAIDAPAVERPRLSGATDAELVALLSHADGWWRDTAQRLLVERRAVGVQDALRRLIAESGNPLARLHAVWTLEGIGAATRDDALGAMRDVDGRVRIAGLRVAEAWIDEPGTVEAMAGLAGDADRNVRIQVALSLGESRGEAAVRAFAAMLRDHEGDGYLRSAVISGLANREIAMIEALVEAGGGGTDRAGWPRTKGGRDALSQLVDCVLRSPVREARTRLLEVIASEAQTNPGRAKLVLGRVARAQKLGSDQPRVIKVSREPSGWLSLVSSETDSLASEAAASNYLLVWPGKVAQAPPVAVRPLTQTEEVLYQRGAQLYTICMACHGPSGEGMAGQYPSLVGSARVLGREDRLAKILLHGLMGPIENGGTVFDGMMPAPTLGSDEDIAAVMTYVRRSWGNDADPVEPRAVTAVRIRNKGRGQPWQAHELDSDQ